MSPDRANTIKFIDWTLGIFRQDWIDAPDGVEKRKAFERLNVALDRRVEVMKLVAYDHAISANEAGAGGAQTAKPKKTTSTKPVPPPPSIE